ncbi:FAD-dependent oxidoreductase [Lactobacillus sp. ESL0731]|uniref:FAD-dependent oxidoreductase n=1 Tax=unclassified Lactobacillus TaxID=2620435 RepID=UPI0023F97423|nr:MULTISPECIES: FAD-dependent oxidoreductase [unclassified Lactobacillus]WEV50639.1 FAD-dependent oxidoreductase [Lactobacillus sp. ESL0700]WEV61769.1 FAD-dependent oxidoreductase [Lactobacillus sp. ESL0731]
MAEYQGKAQGFHGTVSAELEIADNKIVSVAGDYAKNTVGSLAIDRVKSEILAKNSVDVDAISGATFSSTAYRDAAKKAYLVYQGKMAAEEAADPNVELPKAVKSDVATGASEYHGKKAIWNTSPAKRQVYLTEDTQFDESYDVVIAGGGGAGLAAAAQASSEGLSVLLCEKAGLVGGSTSYSGGVIQAAGTKYQKKYSQYQDDNPQKHAQYWIKAGEETVDEDLVKDLAEGAPKNIEWLAKLGINWNSMYGNCHIPYINDDIFADRIHVYEGGGMAGNGAILSKVLLDEAKKNGAEFWYNAPIVSLIFDQEKNKVVGVQVKQNETLRNVKAKKGVVLATAGIDNNPSLAFKLNRQHYDDLQHKTCLSAKSDTGDGIIMGMSVGGAITGMGGCIDFDGKTGNGTDDRMPTIPAIFVNGAGKRFVCEDATYAYQYRAIFEQEKQLAHPTYMIFGENSIEEKGSPWTKDTLAKDVQAGIVLKANSLEELAELIDVPADSLEESVNVWNQAAASGHDSSFARQTGLKAISGPYYAFKNAATNLGSIGGLKITTDCQVVDNFEEPITGLYAAGLTAGGWLGPYYPGSGTAVSGIIHQGRKAAMALAKL